MIVRQTIKPDTFQKNPLVKWGLVQKDPRVPRSLHGKPKLSASAFNSWAENPTSFITSYILKLKSDPSQAMMRGNVAEDILYKVLMNTVNYDDIDKECEKLPSVMITDFIETSEAQVDAVISGGNLVSIYRGMDSYIVAREIGNPIWAPSMGRKQDQEDMIEDIKYMAYMSWREWITALGQFNIGIHLMRTHAAGTFAMNCGFHGIPCIGYKGLDTQETLHPLTTVDVGDLEAANDLAKKLKEDKFYWLCSQAAEKRFDDYYTERAWLENWEKPNG